VGTALLAGNTVRPYLATAVLAALFGPLGVWLARVEMRVRSSRLAAKPPEPLV
jgi:hypothetical protein